MKIDGNMETGRVIKSTGSWYVVELPGERRVECRIRGKFRLEGMRTTNPVAVGDLVQVEEKEREYVIREIMPRKNYIIRKSTNLSKEAHILAANVDQALLVATVNHPVTSTVFIDRFLAGAEAYRIPVVLVFNKTDLYEEEDRALLAEWKGIYEQVGYVCLAVSAETGEGMEEVKALLAGKVTAVAGLSGVGKSSLLNRVEPGLGLKTAVISDAHDSGKHTTTFAEMFPLSGGGYVVDTPGVRSFGMVDMEKEEISHFFPEIFACAEGCRFYNCTHTHEPGCAVRGAVEAGEISASRYASYLSMLEGDGGKYR